MSKRLAVVVIHGMGSHKNELEDNIHLYAKPMIDEVKDRIKDHNSDPERIAWKTIYWADVLEIPEMKYFNEMKKSEVDWMSLRKFIITAFGDASGYRKERDSVNGTYQRVHEKIRDAIKELYENDLGSAPVPLIILAHSLGGHMMSNYIYDRQKSAVDAPNDFERLHTLAGIVTFGCNIPLFTFAYDPIVPIEFPARQLDGTIKVKSKWLNFYDPDDVLGYPLKPICPAYDTVVNEDIPINVGGIFTNWNPASHTEYWTDSSFTGPVAKFISAFLS